MSHDDDRLPDDLRSLAERLRRDAVRPGAEELHRLRPRAMRDGRTVSAGRRGRFVGSRLAAVLAVGVLGAGTGGTIALAGSRGKSDDGSASKHQYKPPGKGCGDKNHEHERKGECKDDEHAKGDDGKDKGKGKGDKAHESKDSGKSKGEDHKATASKHDSKDEDKKKK